jgi:hypothetical protein
MCIFKYVYCTVIHLIFAIWTYIGRCMHKLVYTPVQNALSNVDNMEQQACRSYGELCLYMTQFTAGYLHCGWLKLETITENCGDSKERVTLKKVIRIPQKEFKAS